MQHHLLILIVLPVSLWGQRNLSTDSVAETAEEIFTSIKERHPFAASVEGLKALEAARAQVQKTVKGHTGRVSRPLGRHVSRPLGSGNILKALNLHGLKAGQPSFAPAASPE